MTTETEENTTANKITKARNRVTANTPALLAARQSFLKCALLSFFSFEPALNAQFFDCYGNWFWFV
jgi:hypothetical protein